MPNTDVLDYSWGRPAHATIRAYGVTGCMRYLYASGKGLTAPEVAQFRASGLNLGLNYEAGAGDLKGFGVGVAHAQSAERFAVALGLGGNVVIFSADWDVSSSQYGLVGDAIQGAMSVKGAGKVGIYGHANLIDYCWNRFGANAYYWQTYAWSGGRLSPHADLYQWRNGQKVGGADVDFNAITGRTFWALGKNGAVTAGGTATQITDTNTIAPPAHVQEDDDMPMWITDGKPAEQRSLYLFAGGRLKPVSSPNTKANTDNALQGNPWPVAVWDDSDIARWLEPA